MYSAFAPPLHPEDLVADLELGDGCPDGLDLTCELHPGNPPLRSEEPEEDAREERLGSAKPAVGSGDRRRMNLHEHLVVRRVRPRNLLQP